LTPKRSLQLTDLVGSLSLVAILFGVAWFAFLKPDTASSRVSAIAEQVDRSFAALTKLEAVLAERDATRQRLVATVSSGDSLPTRSPVEHDLRTITKLAERNGIKFLEVAPIGRATYPGVVEQVYRVRSSGRYLDHVRFLQEFESGAFWADVTHLKLEQPPSSVVGSVPIRTSDMTISFFSAVQ
jgi:Tfp pilus assembly protein PilO